MREQSEAELKDVAKCHQLGSAAGTPSAQTPQQLPYFERVEMQNSAFKRSQECSRRLQNLLKIGSGENTDQFGSVRNSDLLEGSVPDVPDEDFSPRQASVTA